MAFKLKRLFNSESGKIIISIILGLGLATLFRKVCDETNCLVYKAKDYSEINDKIFKYDNKCYKYDLKHISCVKDGNIINF